MPSPWELECELHVKRDQQGPDEQLANFPLQVRTITEGDELMMTIFGKHGLSDASRTTFAPYNWESEELAAEFTGSISNSLAHRDLHLLAVDFDPSSLANANCNGSCRLSSNGTCIMNRSDLQVHIDTGHTELYARCQALVAIQ